MACWTSNSPQLRLSCGFRKCIQACICFVYVTCCTHGARALSHSRSRSRSHFSHPRSRSLSRARALSCAHTYTCTCSLLRGLFKTSNIDMNEMLRRHLSKNKTHNRHQHHTTLQHPPTNRYFAPFSYEQHQALIARSMLAKDFQGMCAHCTYGITMTHRNVRTSA